MVLAYSTQDEQGGAEGLAVLNNDPQSPPPSSLPSGLALSEDGGSANVLEWHVERLEVGKGMKRRTVIRNIAGKSQSGDFTVLLAPSGAGKTSFITCLAMRNRLFEGALHYNGKVPGGDFYTSAAMVYQQEVIFGFMTTREHLTFQALARMSRTHTKAQIAKRVEEVMHEARLVKCADTIVGSTSPIFLKRGLSGGERKRVAIATELLRAPDLIFLDEPTTGLDSVMSGIIVGLLSDLCSRGRIVMTSLHCPSSALMQHFTHLILLTHDGRLAYHGPTRAVVPFFERLGYEYPVDYNPADFLMDVLSPTPEAAAKTETGRVDTIVETFQASPWATRKPLPPSNAHKAFTPVKRLGAGYFTLLRINSWRFSVMLRRDTRNFQLWCFVSVLVGLVFGVLFLNQAGKTWRNLTGLTFSLAVTAMMVGVMPELVKFPIEWAPVSREIMAGANAIGPYLLARYTYILPILYVPMIMSTFVYWLTGMDPSWVSYLCFTATMMACMLTSLALGIFASALSNNVAVGITILPGLITPMILFSGMLYQRGTVPAWLSWMEHVSLINYTFSALLLQQYHILRDGSRDTVLKFLAVNPGDLGYDVGMIFVIFIGINLLTYLALLIRMRLTKECI